MGPRTVRMGTPEADRALTNWENSRLDTPDDYWDDEEESDEEDYYEPPEEPELSDSEMDAIADRYFGE